MNLVEIAREERQNLLEEKMQLDWFIDFASTLLQEAGAGTQPVETVQSCDGPQDQAEPAIGSIFMSSMPDDMQAMKKPLPNVDQILFQKMLGDMLERQASGETNDADAPADFMELCRIAAE